MICSEAEDDETRGRSPDESENKRDIVEGRQTLAPAIRLPVAANVEVLARTLPNHTTSFPDSKP
jgi:hypothetical protein